MNQLIVGFLCSNLRGLVSQLASCAHGSGAMEDCASSFYIYLGLRQVCAEHFEELPVQIRKEEILTIHDVKYVVVKELVKHFAEEFHPSVLVNPNIRPVLAEPELIGSLFYDFLKLNLKNREELINLLQLSAYCTIFPRFGTDWYLESTGESDADTIILSDDDHEP